jgi:hypothetical protein
LFVVAFERRASRAVAGGPNGGGVTSAAATAALAASVSALAIFRAVDAARARDLPRDVERRLGLTESSTTGIAARTRADASAACCTTVVLRLATRLIA